MKSSVVKSDHKILNKIINQHAGELMTSITLNYRIATAIETPELKDKKKIIASHNDKMDINLKQTQ